MFTGIIEEMGIVEKVVKGKLMHLVLQTQSTIKETKMGDSINVNGVCLTVVTMDKQSLSIDVMRETQERTNLNLLKVGDGVNLERALSVSSRLGGHIVTGHIDGVGFVRKKIKQKDEFWLEINAETQVRRYIVPQCSIAVDGVSLTVTTVNKECFNVALIPHTLKTTNLGFKEEKSKLNLEVDLFAKYVFRYLETKTPDKTGISKNHLKNLGFIDK